MVERGAAESTASTASRAVDSSRWLVPSQSTRALGRSTRPEWRCSHTRGRRANPKARSRAESAALRVSDSAALISSEEYSTTTSERSMVSGSVAWATSAIICMQLRLIVGDLTGPSPEQHHQVVAGQPGAVDRGQQHTQLGSGGHVLQSIGEGHRPGVGHRVGPNPRLGCFAHHHVNSLHSSAVHIGEACSAYRDGPTNRTPVRKSGIDQYVNAAMASLAMTIQEMRAGASDEMRAGSDQLLKNRLNQSTARPSTRAAAGVCGAGSSPGGPAS